MGTPFLSAVIIAFNEERNISRCLDSLLDIADEVVVVDSGSTDATESLCRDRGVRFIHHSFEGHIQQKNWASKQAKGGWILSLDADEALSESLRQSLKDWKNQPIKDANAYEFNRLTQYCGEWVRHSGWYPDRKLRLWKGGTAHWAGVNPHDRLEVAQPEITGHLKGDILHYSYYTLGDHVNQIAYFSDIAALAYQGGSWAYWPPMARLKSAFQWFKTAIIKGGWRDGKTGWVIARMSARATWMKYRKIRKIRRGSKLLSYREMNRILICRTDAIGDLILTLPLAGWIKATAPQMKVSVLVRSYAEAIAIACTDVDEVLIWDPQNDEVEWGQFDAAILAFPDDAVARKLQKSGVPIRVGTGRRWPTALRLTHRVWQSRKKSGRHETWHGLNLLHVLHLLPGWSKPGLVVPQDPVNWVPWLQLQPVAWKSQSINIVGADDWLEPGKKHVILHPGSRGSANNWSLANYQLAMDQWMNRGIRVVLTGTEDEGETFKSLRSVPGVIDTIGRLSLGELLSLIQACDGLVASSTGPLHMAAAVGVPCVGLFGHAAPMWPERWHPIGTNARWLVAEKVDEQNGLQIAPEKAIECLEGIWENPSP